MFVTSRVSRGVSNIRSTYTELRHYWLLLNGWQEELIQALGDYIQAEATVWGVQFGVQLGELQSVGIQVGAIQVGTHRRGTYSSAAYILGTNSVGPSVWRRTNAPGGILWGGALR